MREAWAAIKQEARASNRVMHMLFYQDRRVDMPWGGSRRSWRGRAAELTRSRCGELK